MLAALGVGGAILADGHALIRLILVPIGEHGVNEVGFGENHVRLGDPELSGNAGMRQIPWRIRPLGKIGQEPLRLGSEP